MSTPTYIRVAGKLYRRADIDVIQETRGRDCGCGGKTVQVKPEEADIASEEFAMQGFGTRHCREDDAVCVSTPPGQPEAVPHVRTIGGDTITSRLRQNWPSQAFKPYNGATMSTPKFIRVDGQVYRRAEPSAPELAQRLEIVYGRILPLITRAVAPGATELYSLSDAITALENAAANLALSPDQQFPRPRP